jgi:LAO/AO transport system kinase
MTRKARRSVDEYAAGVLAADRALLAQAITLVESRVPSVAALAQELLTRVLQHTGGARRLGVTGVPGVGKSTFIDALGEKLCAGGHKVAVLAIDPSSALSGGSILGDKTRMARLSMNPRAYIRPSPSGLTLGGVARRTRETMLLCEAAGYDVVIVETVGVGQSETVVSEMVDFFLVLLLPGAGDELQGIKKGILELADAVAVNKADGDNQTRAQLALREVEAAQRYTRPRSPAWKPRALAVSALTGMGLDELWKIAERHHRELAASGALAERRREQQLRWLWTMIEERLGAAFRAHPRVATRLAAIESDVRDGRVPPTQAARQLLAAVGVSGGAADVD